MEKVVFNCLHNSRKSVPSAKQFDVEYFQASDGCLRYLKKRNNNNIQEFAGWVKVSYTRHGKCTVWNVPYNFFVKLWYGRHLQHGQIRAILSIPSKWSKPPEVGKMLWRKLIEIRITGMATTNTVSDKLPMFVTGKGKRPWCFKNTIFLPCRCLYQQKIWMDWILFEEWVRELDWKFASEGRNVDLVIDNCHPHPQLII